MTLPCALVSLDPSLREAAAAAPESLRRLANRAALGVVDAGSRGELQAWAATLGAPVSLVHAGPARDTDLFRGLAARARLEPGRVLHASADPEMLQAAAGAGCATACLGAPAAGPGPLAATVAATDLPGLVAAILALDAPKPLPSHPLSGRHPEAYLRGIQFFATGRYYEAHEEWERLYMTTVGRERDFWRGLIQVAAACLQARRGNAEGATRLWTSARTLLAPFGPVHRQLDLDAWLPAVAAWLQAAPPGGGRPHRPSAPREAVFAGSSPRLRTKASCVKSRPRKARTDSVAGRAPPTS